MRILIVEDETALAETLRRGLTEEHYVVDTVADGRDAVDYALAAPYDVIILDIMLPGLDGLAVCRAQGPAGLARHNKLRTAVGEVDASVHRRPPRPPR
jgi:two-component system OmpR family response regulator